MLAHRFSGPRSPVVVGIVLCALGLSSAEQVQAQAIQADGTAVGLSTTVNQAGIDYQISGGKLSGNNQFYSLSKVSVPTGGSADFQAATGGIQNILARVTGGAASSIDGLLTSTITGSGGTLGNANLFLINPAGILFGDNAQLNLAASFHATTADYIKFSDGGIFAANPPPGDEVLSSAAPSAFGFLASNTGEISYTTPSFNFLNVNNGKTLSLVSKKITIGDDSNPGILIGLNATPDEAANFEGQIGGRINLVSVVGTGVDADSAAYATFDGTNINTDGVAQLGTITIQGGSVIDAGEVFIRSGKLEIKDSFVYPGGVPKIFEVFQQPSGGQVNVDVRNDVTISGSDFIYGISPGIRTWSGSETSPTLAPGADAPDITIHAGGSVAITGTGTVRSERFGPGATSDTGGAADISITAGSSVKILNGGTVVLRNTYAGPGGSITINAPQVEISSDTPGVTGISAQATLHPDYFSSDESADARLTEAEGGTITVNAPGSLTLRQAQITTDSSSFARSADITVNAGDVSMSNGAVIAAQSLYAGESGNVHVHATGAIDISGGSRISASTAGSGDSGVVDVTADRSLSLSGTDSAIYSVTVPVPDTALDALAFQILKEYPGPGQFPTFADLLYEAGLPPTATIFDLLSVLTNDYGVAAVDKFTPGDGGKISVTTPLLSLSDGAVLSSSTLWQGNAGEIEAHVANLSVTGGAQIRSQSGGIRLDNNQPAVGTDCTTTTCNAGTVALTASNAITVSGTGSAISTTTFGDGNGGDVMLNAGNQVSILDGGRVKADSGGTLGGSVVSGTGLAGNVSISSGNQIYLNNGQITTQALTADGGNIKLTAPNTVQLQDSVISTSVAGGLGQGGNINIDPQFVLLNGSSIIANAYGGPGGNITIVADNFLQSTDSVISASSALSTPGTIQIQSPDNNVESSIAQLPSSFLDAASLLRGLCSARRTGAPSSFVVAGRGGVPVDADSYLPSFGTDTAAAMASAEGAVETDAGAVHAPRLALALLIPPDLNCAR
jgi:filamentous hemagglutinin family protein